jgi:hypothetical protein
MSDPEWLRLRCFVVDNVDFFIARDRQDVERLYVELYGETYEQIVGDKWEDATVDAVMLERPLTVHDEFGPTESAVTRTVADWIRHNGRGFLCSTEW